MPFKRGLRVEPRSLRLSFLPLPASRPPSAPRLVAESATCVPVLEGPFKMALRAGVPIVPVSICGLAQVLRMAAARVPVCVRVHAHGACQAPGAGCRVTFCILCAFAHGGPIVPVLGLSFGAVVPKGVANAPRAATRRSSGGPRANQRQGSRGPGQRTAERRGGAPLELRAVLTSQLPATPLLSPCFSVCASSASVDEPALRPCSYARECTASSTRRSQTTSEARRRCQRLHRCAPWWELRPAGDAINTADITALLGASGRPSGLWPR